MAAPASHPRPRFSPSIKTHPSVMGITPGVAVKWGPNLALWGAGAAFGVALYASGIPIFQRDILNKLGLAAYYEDDTPDSDKPF